MKTRCKVRCEMITPVHFTGGEEGQSAQFRAVYDADPNSENGRFFQATPCALFQVGTTKGTPFESGKDYYVDFIAIESA